VIPCVFFIYTYTYSYAYIKKCIGISDQCWYAYIPIPMGMHWYGIWVWYGYALRYGYAYKYSYINTHISGYAYLRYAHEYLKCSQIHRNRFTYTYIHIINLFLWMWHIYTYNKSVPMNVATPEICIPMLCVYTHIYICTWL